MGMVAKVQSSEDFTSWLAAQADDAVAPASSEAVRGMEIFLQTGCGACHAVRGTPAKGRIGPDLTHIGSRDRIAAATFDHDRERMLRWLAHARQLKPGALMPSFDMLSDAELSALAAYLAELQ
jgi:cytochrome c oxidase subunit 2